MAKVSRGGGRHFSKYMNMDNGGEKESREENDDDSSEEESEESEEEQESSENEAGKSAGTAQPALTRTDKRDLKKKQEEEKQKQEQEEDPDLINPNHVQQKLNISDLNTPRVLTRREREQKEKQEAKDKYWKLHLQGKTDEAKADLSRLAKVRAEREAAQAKRIAEAQAKAAEVEAKKQAQLAKRT